MGSPLRVPETDAEAYRMLFQLQMNHCLCDEPGMDFQCPQCNPLESVHSPEVELQNEDQADSKVDEVPQSSSSVLAEIPKAVKAGSSYAEKLQEFKAYLSSSEPLCLFRVQSIGVRLPLRLYEILEISWDQRPRYNQLLALKNALDNSNGKGVALKESNCSIVQAVNLDLNDEAASDTDTVVADEDSYLEDTSEQEATFDSNPNLNLDDKLNSEDMSTLSDNSSISDSDSKSTSSNSSNMYASSESEGKSTSSDTSSLDGIFYSDFKSTLSENSGLNGKSDSDDKSSLSSKFSLCSNSSWELVKPPPIAEDNSHSEDEREKLLNELCMEVMPTEGSNLEEKSVGNSKSELSEPVTQFRGMLGRTRYRSWLVGIPLKSAQVHQNEEEKSQSRPKETMNCSAPVEEFDDTFYSMPLSTEGDEHFKAIMSAETAGGANVKDDTIQHSNISLSSPNAVDFVKSNDENSNATESNQAPTPSNMDTNELLPKTMQRSISSATFSLLKLPEMGKNRTVSSSSTSSIDSYDPIDWEKLRNPNTFAPLTIQEVKLIPPHRRHEYLKLLANYRKAGSNWYPKEGVKSAENNSALPNESWSILDTTKRSNAAASCSNSDSEGKEVKPSEELTSTDSVSSGSSSYSNIALPLNASAANLNLPLADVSAQSGSSVSNPVMLRPVGQGYQLPVNLGASTGNAAYNQPQQYSVPNLGGGGGSGSGDGSGGSGSGGSSSGSGGSSSGSGGGFPTNFPPPHPTRPTLYFVPITTYTPVVYEPNTGQWIPWSTYSSTSPQPIPFMGPRVPGICGSPYIRPPQPFH